MLPPSSSLSFSTLIRPFLQLSYPVPRPAHTDSFHNSNYYTTGPLDVCFIISCMVVFAVGREVVRLHIMTPFANKYLFGSTKGFQKYKRISKANGKHSSNGISNGNGVANGNGHYAVRKISAKNRVRERNVIRFAEQGWSLVYFIVAWSFGLYIHFSLPTSPWRLDYLWTTMPHAPIAAPLKLYYLTQCAYWVHQLFVLNAEAHRKDHIQMMTHHVITICLIVTSYFMNCTRIGCIIFVLMDLCDIVLPLAKMLRYLELPRACDAAFVTFIVSWFMTRHVGFLLVLYSLVFRYPILRPDHVVDWDTKRQYNKYHYYCFTAALGALQVLMWIWFMTIVSIVWQFVQGRPAEDTRSDDEELPDSSDDEIELDDKKRQ